MINLKERKYSRDDLSFIKEMKEKLRKLNLIQQTTNAMITQFDLHRKISNQRKFRHSLETKRILPQLSYRLNEQYLLKDKRKFEIKTLNNIDLKLFNIKSPNLISSIDDEFSSMISTLQDNYQEDSHLSKSSYEKYRTTTHSIISSLSSPSKNSHDELIYTPNIQSIGKIYILNEIYPSINSENFNQIPLAFLGSEKFLHIQINWTKVQYPLSSYYIEIIIDLILSRPSFIREIPKVTQFNIYRPLIRSISGRLFFDHGKQRAASHHCCHRKLTNSKFTIEDLASIHRREYYIINSNAIHEQRFINLYENLFPIHHTVSIIHTT